MRKRKLVHLKFDSVSDAVDQINQPWHVETNGERAKRFFVRERGNSLDWYGIEGSAPAVVRAMSHGFDEGANMVENMLSTMRADLPPAEGIRRRLVRGMVGDELDIHAVNRGDLGRSWISRKRTVKRGISCISIIADVCGNCKHSASGLRWRGVAAIAVHNLLERAGYATEITAAMSVTKFTRGGGYDCLVEIVVKPQYSQVDTSMLAATLTLAGFFRVVGFAGFARAADGIGKAVDGELGYPQEVLGIYPYQCDKQTLVVPSSVDSRSTATKWINDTIEMLQERK